MIELIDGSYKARLLKDSVSPHGVRLTTMEVTYPRFILAEFNTHRVLSRNSASSRAIPVATTLKRIEQHPFVPEYWGKNQKGMTAEEEVDAFTKDQAIKEWLEAKDDAIKHARRLLDLGIHKQIANRLLEPFSYHTVLVTATEWKNYFALRDHPEAQPEIRKISAMMKEIYWNGIPIPMGYDGWHLPLTTPQEIAEDYARGSGESDATCYEMYSFMDRWKRISAGRCARVSYLTHDGKRDIQADIDLCERLRISGHMSPLEHVARPMTEFEQQQKYWSTSTIGESPFLGNFRGWFQFRKEFKHEDNFAKVTESY